MVFGQVISGQEVIQTMERQKTDASSKPYSEVKIMNCGELIPKTRGLNTLSDTTSHPRFKKWASSLCAVYSLPLKRFPRCLLSSVKPGEKKKKEKAHSEASDSSSSSDSSSEPSSESEESEKESKRRKKKVKKQKKKKQKKAKKERYLLSPP